MGRAQVMQAEAAGVKPSVLMNPVLLKPTNDVGSQVIVNGEVLGVMPAREYFKYKKNLIPEVMKAYNQLSKENDIIVIEGAGSPAEINLKTDDDFVNMGMAELADAPVLLVGDIDRGGVFAQLIGTVDLLDEDERNRIKGLIINKFRGDKTILEPGVAMIEERANIPVVGVTPYINIQVDDEDSLSSRLEDHREVKLIDIAVIRLPRISNFTDFNPFEMIEGVSLRYVKHAGELGNPDMVILPGTKNTMEDLLWMRQNGLEASILKLAKTGTVIFGICGGYQMMGRQILDPDHVEGEWEALPGLGLLPTVTRMSGEKVTRQVKFHLCEDSTVMLDGYEIHMGVTTPVEGETMLPLNQMDSGEWDGCWVNDTCMGTYIHGILDNPSFIDFLLKPHAHKLTQQTTVFDYQQFKEQQYDKLADHVRMHVNLPLVYQILTEEYD
jgi:adenosylcobyric acid synthase